MLHYLRNDSIAAAALPRIDYSLRNPPGGLDFVALEYG